MGNNLSQINFVFAKISLGWVINQALKKQIGSLISRPGQRQGLLYQHLYGLIQEIILFLPQLYSAVTPKQLEIAIPIIE